MSGIIRICRNAEDFLPNLERQYMVIGHKDAINLIELKLSLASYKLSLVMHHPIFQNRDGACCPAEEFAFLNH